MVRGYDRLGFWYLIMEILI